MIISDTQLLFRKEFNEFTSIAYNILALVYGMTTIAVVNIYVLKILPANYSPWQFLPTNI